jgi:murein DD-endopeptidase MepM/ murein hydrolase activator NlpD
VAGELVVLGGGTQTQSYGNTTWALQSQREWNCPGRGSQGYSFHAGVDLAARSGTPLLAVGYGRVRKVGRVEGSSCGGLGPFAVCVTSGAVDIWYGHCARNLVNVGDQVIPGQQIALMGFIGCVSPMSALGSHVHYEVQPTGLVDGCQSLSPYPYLQSWPGQPAAPPAPSPGLPPPAPAPQTSRAALALLLGAGGLLLLRAGQGRSRPSPGAP